MYIGWRSPSGKGNSEQIANQFYSECLWYINDFNQMQCIKKFKSKYNSTTRKEYRRNQESDSTRFGDKSPSSCTYPCAMLARSLPDRCHGKKGTATSFTWQVSLLSFQIVHPGFFALLPHLRLLRKTRPKWVTSNKIQTI